MFELVEELLVKGGAYIFWCWYLWYLEENFIQLRVKELINDIVDEWFISISQVYTISAEAENGIIQEVCGVIVIKVLNSEAFAKWCVLCRIG